MAQQLRNPVPTSIAASAPIVAAGDPPSDFTAQQYEIGQVWINTASQEHFTLVAFDAGAPVWIGDSAGTGTFASLTVDPGPSELTGVLTVVADVNQAEAISLHEDGGTDGTIEIAALQGTGDDAIKIQAVVGGIQITNDGAAKNIDINSTAGSVLITASEDAASAIQLLVDGGVSSTILVQNDEGTGAASISLNAVKGGIQAVANAAGKDIIIQSVLGSLSLQGNENVAECVQLGTNGGVLSSVAISNLSGTDDASTIADAAIHIGATLGGVGILAGKDIKLEAVSDAAMTSTGGDVELVSDTGDVNLTATTGQLVVTAGGGIDLNITGSIDLDATDNSHFTVTGASKDLLLSSVGGSVNIAADEAAVDAITIDASAGGLTISANDAFGLSGGANSNVSVTGAGVNLSLTTNGGSLLLNADEAAIDAIDINASDVAGGINVDAGTGGIAIDTTGALSLDAAAASNLTVTGAFDLTVDSSAGSVVIEGGEAVADAVQLTATDVAGGVTVTGGTGGVIINSTGAFSAGAAAASDITVIGAFDLTMSSSAGSVILDGGEAVANAIDINASDVAGGINMDAGTGGIAIDTTGALSLDSAAASNFTVTGAFDLTLNSSAGSVVVTGAEAAADAIDINASDAAGGIDMDAGTGGVAIDTTGAFSIDGVAASNVTVTGAGADLTVAAAGGSLVLTASEAVDNAIQIYASDPLGGVLITGSTTGNVSVANNQSAAAAGPNPTVAKTLNARVGSVTFSGYTQAASGTLVVTLTNSYIATTSAILATVTNEGANDAQMYITRIKPAAGSAEITILNGGAAALNGDMVLSFWVLS